jgi:hypothetical protein
LIALQKKIDGQSLANNDDVPWYGVGPSEPTPIPILGPDIIDPRQMDTIRRQAELAAQGQPFGIRELPPKLEIKRAIPARTATAAATEVKQVGPVRDEATMKLIAERRLEALARKRAFDAKKQG